VEVVIADVAQARRILAAAAPGAEIECPGAGRLVLRRAALPACEINRLLVEAGLAVMELRPLRPSLEQLVLTGRRAGEQPC
jgi:hypothetical protein